MQEYKPFNPLDRHNLAAAVGEALLERDPVPLGNVEPFLGTGVYVIYYSGPFPAYSRITTENSNNQWNAPIYVGKAVPPGSRKGQVRPNSAQTAGLQKRLEEHRDSIVSAENLEIEDFWCRFLVVEDIWIPLGESLMITRFSPIWNSLITGFGNHDPGRGRYNQLRSRWDVLHPGREWAERCRARDEKPELISMEIEDHLRARPISDKRPLFDI